MRGSTVLLAGIAQVLAPLVYGAEEFSFDAAEFEKRPYELNGYAEMTYEHFNLEQDSAAFLINVLPRSTRLSLDRGTGVVEISGSYRKDPYSLLSTLHSYYQHDDLGEDDQTQVYEAFARYQANSQRTAELGKRALKWGKGYAWNPVGFVERPKDPNDPELAREGYVVAALDYIKTYSTDLHTIAITPVLLPVTDDINNDYGKTDKYNVAAKVYFLYRDTDIDLVALSEGSRSARYGVDMSRNLSPNFEVHGEWAYLSETSKPLIDADGVVALDTTQAQQWLLGLRYLNEYETTYILEYYYNSAGYSDAQMKTFYEGVKTAAATSLALLKPYKEAGTHGYLNRNPGKQYTYLRISQKEPFNILYFTPAITLIFNVEDRSYSVTPEFLYTGISDLELRLKTYFLVGSEFSEFGEKQNNFRLEARARYYF